MSPTGALVPGIELRELRDFLNRHDIAVIGSLHVTTLAGGKSNLTYRVSDDESSWVLRRPPVGELLPTAHDIAREFNVMSALRNSTVPVPKTIALCRGGGSAGVPFSIVEYVHGQTVRSQADLSLLSNVEVKLFCQDLVNVLVRLHRVDYHKVGLSKLGHPEGFLNRQVELWRKQWVTSRTRIFPDVITLYRTLADRLPTISPATSLAHGDYREDNTIIDFANGSVIKSVVDWEMATLGNPIFDLALFCVYRDPLFDLILGLPAASTSSRLPAVDDFVESYAQLSSRDIKNWNFYYALGYFKLAVIAEGIRSRNAHTAIVQEDNQATDDAVPGLIAAGLRIIK